MPIRVQVHVQFIHERSFRATESKFNSTFPTSHTFADYFSLMNERLNSYCYCSGDISTGKLWKNPDKYRPSCI